MPCPPAYTDTTFFMKLHTNLSEHMVRMSFSKASKKTKKLRIVHIKLKARCKINFAISNTCGKLWGPPRRVSGTPQVLPLLIPIGDLVKSIQ